MKQVKAPLEITEAERARLAELRALSTDDQGRELLVGLTVQESAEYIVLMRSGDAGQSINHDRCAKLDDQHELARQSRK